MTSSSENTRDISRTPSIALQKIAVGPDVLLISDIAAAKTGVNERLD
jgi:hypothetical protein